MWLFKRHVCHLATELDCLTWLRCLKQCLRRYYDEKDTHQLENAGKYMSAIVALELRQAYSNHENLKVLGAFSVITSIIATIYASYWDLCVDWGLLNRKSKNKWLRDKIILQRKSVYFVCIVSYQIAEIFVEIFNSFPLCL